MNPGTGLVFNRLSRLVRGVPVAAGVVPHGEERQ
jgi:hypothetical protein